MRDRPWNSSPRCNPARLFDRDTRKLRLTLAQLDSPTLAYRKLRNPTVARSIGIDGQPQPGDVL
ncbi:hypothetical protein [Peristeroidobacter agariperforans]|uniref:hypothetical protein n=1 Tax=Peristeroidobacter agariperforans TaxID=268404 RepID=UPI00101C41AD|nr:hypothetical protein [Peristeroidobacter agariperforans]